MDDEEYNILIEYNNLEEEVYLDTIQFFKDNFILVTSEKEKWIFLLQKKQ